MRDFLNRTQRLLLVSSLLMTALVVLPGCAGGMGGSIKEQLQRSTLMYFDGIRWKRFSQSELMIPPAERISFVQKREDARERFFVTECEVKGMVYDGDSETAMVEVEYKWYNLPSMTIQTTRLQQRWEYQESWLMVEQHEVSTSKDEKGPEKPTSLL